MSGFADQGQVLINTLADGVRIDDIWAEINSAVDLYNREKTTVASLLSFPTTDAAAPIAQALAQEHFDIASEYGVPTAMNPVPDVLKMGFDFHDWDKATRFTWKFLRDASSEQVSARVSAIMDADARLVQGLVLNRLFDPTPGENDFAHIVYPLWSNDGIVPPSYMGRDFTGSHNHYLVSQAAEIDSGDVEAAMRLVTEHGYGLGSGSQLVLLVNPAEAEQVQSWRAGEENANSQTARFDFIQVQTRRVFSQTKRSSAVFRPPMLTVSRCSAATARRGSSSRGWCRLGTSRCSPPADLTAIRT